MAPTCHCSQRWAASAPGNFVHVFKVKIGDIEFGMEPARELDVLSYRWAGGLLAGAALAAKALSPRAITSYAALAAPDPCTSLRSTLRRLAWQ